jgi:hypothetical protein
MGSNPKYRNVKTPGFGIMMNCWRAPNV